MLKDLDPPKDFGFIVRTAGIGRTKAQEICSQLALPAERRVNELTDGEVISIRELIDANYQVVQ